MPRRHAAIAGNGPCGLIIRRLTLLPGLLLGLSLGLLPGLSARTLAVDSFADSRATDVGSGRGQETGYFERLERDKANTPFDVSSDTRPETSSETSPETSSETSLDEVAEISPDSAPDNPLTTLLTPRGPSAIRLRALTPQLYETSDGADAFVLLINQDVAYIRFLCGSESVLPLECQLIGPSGVEETALLSATRSPRGDVIYKNDGGEAVLRVTATGGATLFTPRGGPSPEDRSAIYRGGRAVLPVPGKSGNISLPEVYYWEIDQRMRLAGDLLSAHLGRKVIFDIIDPEWGNQAVLADALLTAVKAINIVASDELGKRIVAERISEVHFKEADEPSVSLENTVVYITYNESMGIRGRPSSTDIALFLESAL